MNYYSKIDFLLKCARLARHLSVGLSKKPNFYELLGLSPKATVDEIKNAYFEKTKLYHPDIVGSSEENLALFRQVSEAYEVLGSPTLRRDYDENILGLSRENQNDTEDDPIAVYKNKISNQKMSSWTKEHYNHLRKQQYAHTPFLHNRSKKKKGAESSKPKYFFSFLLVLVSLGLVTTVHFDSSNLEKILKIGD